MPDGDATLTLTLHARIAEIGPADWNACAGPDNPFVSYGFLSTLEDSGSASARTGWLPQHMALRSPAGDVLAVAPAYAKSHSYGEYVFDHGWADALERAGGRYYPKLQVAVPFSPVPGPRLLRRPGSGVTPAVLGQCLAQACQELKFSSVHVTFCEEAEAGALTECGWLHRTGMQFHWENAGYNDFDAFLGALSSRKRKTLRRERRDANASGLVFRTLTGPEISKGHWDAFFRFYTSTVDRKWGSAYLTRRFFTMLGERLGERVVLMLAEDPSGRAVAGALNLAGTDTLYGRNWGSTGDWPFLHFELCYYRAIDYAIAHGLKSVEAGAQGRHKIQRGYLPQITHSAHWIAHPGLRRAVARFLDEERPAIRDEAAALAAESPFKQEEH
ncbi:MAG: N-acetyltransferase [Acetobacteraceae bacterium]|nr:N-acetyltransferase [Acetobacteraceae bacterium]